MVESIPPNGRPANPVPPSEAFEQPHEGLIDKLKHAFKREDDAIFASDKTNDYIDRERTGLRPLSDSEAAASVQVPVAMGSTSFPGSGGLPGETTYPRVSRPLGLASVSERNETTLTENEKKDLRVLEHDQ